MKKYELVILFDQSMTGDELKEFFEGFEKKIGDKLIKKDDIGLLNLSYNLNSKKGNDRAYFVSYYLNLEQSDIENIKEEFKYNKFISRYKIFFMKKNQEMFEYEELNKKLQSIIDGWGKQRFGQKVIYFAGDENAKNLDWKAVSMLRKYITRFGDIKPRRYTKNSVSRQKKVRKNIIRAREFGLIDYIK